MKRNCNSKKLDSKHEMIQVQQMKRSHTGQVKWSMCPFVGIKYGEGEKVVTHLEFHSQFEDDLRYDGNVIDGHSYINTDRHTHRHTEHTNIERDIEMEPVLARDCVRSYSLSLDELLVMRDEAG